jgi:hypothetical protein
MNRRSIDIEGYTPEEILSLEDEQIEAFFLTGTPLAFRAGSAEILGQFEVKAERLVLELAHIDGGGEGVLPTLAALAKRYAQRRQLKAVEWIVYATNCARPNLKLRRVLERRGFQVIAIEGKGDCYHLIDELS